jgi:hypothetical protein
METQYGGLTFKTQLIATWAAFFDLAEWTWHTNPASVGDWQPDFLLEFACGHSDCTPTHKLLACVLPVSKLSAFEHHPALRCWYGDYYVAKGYSIPISADGGAVLGSNPAVTQWEFSHGAGGGIEDIEFRVLNANELWAKAVALVSASAAIRSIR